MWVHLVHAAVLSHPEHLCDLNQEGQWFRVTKYTWRCPSGVRHPTCNQPCARAWRAVCRGDYAIRGEGVVNTSWGKENDDCACLRRGPECVFVLSAYLRSQTSWLYRIRADKIDARLAQQTAEYAHRERLVGSCHPLKL